MLVTDSPESRSESSKIDLAFKMGIRLVGVFYAVGFLVVTFHLSTFGVAPITWLRPQYLLAGIWCLLPLLLFSCALAFAGLQYAEPFIRRSMVGPRRRIIYRHVIGGIQGTFALVAAFVFISLAVSKVTATPVPTLFKWVPSEIITLKLALLSLLIAATAFTAIRQFSTLGRSPEWKRVDQAVALGSSATLVAFASVALSILYIWYFSVAVYSAIPSAVGGGSPQSVVFIVDAVPGQTPPVIIDSSGTRSIPYNLILRTDTRLAIPNYNSNQTSTACATTT